MAVIPSFIRSASRAFGRGGASGAKAMSKGMQTFTGAMAIGIPTAMGYSSAPKGQKLRGTIDGLTNGLITTFMPGYWVAEGLAGVAEGLGNWYMERMHQGPWERINAGKANFGGNFRDTQQAATMRQRALEEMQNSHINARSVLGSEARTYHRSGAYSGRY